MYHIKKFLHSSVKLLPVITPSSYFNEIIKINDFINYKYTPLLSIKGELRNFTSSFVDQVQHVFFESRTRSG